LEESLTMLGREAPRLSGARVLVVAAPLERFAERPGPDRCREAWPMASSLIRYSLSWQMCQNSWKVAHFQGSGTEADHGASLSSPEPAEADRQLYASWDAMFGAFDPALAQQRLRLLRQTLVPWRARGARLLFWAPPLRPDTRALIAKYHLEEAWSGLAGQLRELGPVVDLKDADGLPGLPFTFRDPVHVVEGPAILERLLREKLE
jgi:hypothetical protein